jgi:hypothetical protein
MKRYAFLFLAVIFLLTGCTAFSKKDKSSTGVLEPQALAKFADVPVPAGFKILPEESYSFESSGVRVGVLKYRGKANVEQVENFYKEQMPMYNWNFLNVVEYGERLLNFDRESETCIISLLSKGSQVNITITLGPKSQMRKKSDKPLK